MLSEEAKLDSIQSDSNTEFYRLCNFAYNIFRGGIDIPSRFGTKEIFQQLYGADHLENYGFLAPKFLTRITNVDIIYSKTVGSDPGVSLFILKCTTTKPAPNNKYFAYFRFCYNICECGRLKCFTKDPLKPKPCLCSGPNILGISTMDFKTGRSQSLVDLLMTLALRNKVHIPCSGCNDTINSTKCNICKSNDIGLFRDANNLDLN